MTMGKGRKESTALSSVTKIKENKKKSKKSKELRSKDNYYNIITQNVNGLKQVEKIETIVNIMETHNIDIYMAQETWLEGP